MTLKPPNKTAIISDVHGDLELLRGLLVHIGAVDPVTSTKRTGWTLYQVGDLVHRAVVPYSIRVPASATREQREKLCFAERARDLACLEQARLWLDAACIGNHEAPDLGGLAFNQYDGDPSLIHDRVVQYYRDGFYRASICVGDWLISHAGLHTRFWGKLGLSGATALEVCERTNDGVQEALRSKASTVTPWSLPTWFFGIGAERWGGPFRMEYGGGMVWCGFEQLVESYEIHYGAVQTPDDCLKQIVGHTPDPRGPLKADTYPLVDIDVGAKRGFLCAAITDDNGASWRTEKFTLPLK